MQTEGEMVTKKKAANIVRAQGMFAGVEVQLLMGYNREGKPEYAAFGLQDEQDFKKWIRTLQENTEAAEKFGGMVFATLKKHPEYNPSTNRMETESGEGYKLAPRFKRWLDRPKRPMLSVELVRGIVILKTIVGDDAEGNPQYEEAMECPSKIEFRRWIRNLRGNVEAVEERGVALFDFLEKQSRAKSVRAKKQKA